MFSGLGAVGTRGLEPSCYSYFSSYSTIGTIACMGCNKSLKYPKTLESSVSKNWDLTA